MPPMNLHWNVFGRPIKPVAFALMWSLLVVAWAAFTNQGVLDGSDWADALGGGSIVVASMFMTGWWKNSQRMAEWALLSAFYIWAVRFFLVVLVANNPISQEGLWLSIGWMIVSGGSYLLEKTDPNASYERFSQSKWE
jgi:hypothetical protein